MAADRARVVRERMRGQDKDGTGASLKAVRGALSLVPVRGSDQPGQPTEDKPAEVWVPFGARPRPPRPGWAVAVLDAVRHPWPWARWAVPTFGLWLSRVAVHAYRGVTYGVPALVRWVLYEEATPLRLHHADNKDLPTWDRVSKVQRRVRSTRAWITVGGVVAVGALFALVAALPLLLRWAVVVGAVWALAAYGARAPRRDGKPVEAPKKRADARVTSEQIHEAFHHADLGDVVEVVPPHRSGPGYETVVELPKGKKTFRDVVAAREALAGNLGTGVGHVFLEQVRDHAKRVVLWKADHDPMYGDFADSPLTALIRKGLPYNLWDNGVPLGVDARGRPVSIPLPGTNGVMITAQAGAGKTFLVFHFGMAAALDPLFGLDIISFKPDGAFKALRPLAGTYITNEQDRAVELFLDYIEQLKELARQQNIVLAGLDEDENDESKLTKEIAAAHGIRPRVVIIDELQHALAHPKLGDKVAAGVGEMNRILRSLVIIPVMVFQRGQADVSKELQSYAGTRICLSVNRVPDSIAGLASAHVTGLIDASTIPLDAPGVCFVKGGDNTGALSRRTAFMARAYRANKKIVRDAATLGIELRRRQGITPAGVPSSDKAEAFQVDAAVLWEPGDRSARHLTTVARELVARHPDRWGHLDADTVAALCAAAGIEVKQRQREPGSRQQARGVTGDQFHRA
jgi:hypothetical protein